MKKHTILFGILSFILLCAITATFAFACVLRSENVLLQEEMVALRSIVADVSVSDAKLNAAEREVSCARAEINSLRKQIDEIEDKILFNNDFYDETADRLDNNIEAIKKDIVELTSKVNDMDANVTTALNTAKDAASEVKGVFEAHRRLKADTAKETLDSRSRLNRLEENSKMQSVLAGWE